MKSFFRIFKDSAEEFKSVKCLTVTSIFIAISMVIETYTIEIPYAKINFAFLAIAVIGMLFGPTVGLLAGGMCDVVGFIVHPNGGFIPAYVVIGALQGLVYGIILYRKRNSHSIILQNNENAKQTDITLYIRAVLARLVDVVFINLFVQTHVNMHYGFIPKQAYGEAIFARTAKNAIELLADIPLLFVLLPVALTAYQRIFKSSSAKNVT